MMASKNTGYHVKKDTVKIKYVKRARMWCKTVIEEGKQTITWASIKEEL